MKYAADVCQRKRNYKESKKTESNNSNNENIGRKLFDILYPIEHQICRLDVRGKIVQMIRLLLVKIQELNVDKLNILFCFISMQMIRLLLVKIQELNK